MLEDITEEMFSVLLEPETKKLHQIEELIKENELIPATAFQMLSNIAFELAMRSLETDENFEIAGILEENANRLFNSNRVSIYNKDRLKREMSETLLDLGYAAGNKNIASIRMAPYIRSKRDDHE